MPLKIKVRTTKMVPVKIVSLRWAGKITDGSVSEKFHCSACGERLGARKFAVAMIERDGVQQSLRLCEDCGIKAETP